jgi:hypothetical protein
MPHSSSAHQLPLNREKHVAVESAVLGRAGVHGACTRVKKRTGHAQNRQGRPRLIAPISIFMGRRLTRSALSCSAVL